MSEPQASEPRTSPAQTGQARASIAPASASWATATFPAVPPDAKFRADLQRALEQTHRQQTAQRKLGAPPTAQRRQAQQQRFLLGWLILAIISGIGLWWLFRPKPASGKARP